MLAPSWLDHREEPAFPVGRIGGDQPEELSGHRARRFLALFPGTDRGRRGAEEAGEDGLADAQRRARLPHVLGPDPRRGHDHDHLADRALLLKSRAVTFASAKRRALSPAAEERSAAAFWGAFLGAIRTRPGDRRLQGHEGMAAPGTMERREKETHLETGNPLRYTD